GDTARAAIHAAALTVAGAIDAGLPVLAGITAAAAVVNVERQIGARAVAHHGACRASLGAARGVGAGRAGGCVAGSCGVCLGADGPRARAARAWTAGARALAPQSSHGEGQPQSGGNRLQMRPDAELWGHKETRHQTEDAPADRTV